MFLLEHVEFHVELWIGIGMVIGEVDVVAQEEIIAERESWVGPAWSLPNKKLISSVGDVIATTSPPCPIMHHYFHPLTIQTTCLHKIHNIERTGYTRLRWYLKIEPLSVARCINITSK